MMIVDYDVSAVSLVQGAPSDLTLSFVGIYVITSALLGQLQIWHK